MMQRLFLTIALAVYRVAFLVYPTSFRRAYGEEAVQVLRTACRQRRRVAEPLGAALWDVLLSAPGAHLDDLGFVRNLVTALAAMTAGMVVADIHTATDADTVAALCVWSAALLWAAVPWRGLRHGALLTGLAVLAVALLAPDSTVLHDPDQPLAVLLLPAVCAAICGRTGRAAVATILARRTESA